MMRRQLRKQNVRILQLEASVPKKKKETIPVTLELLQHEETIATGARQYTTLTCIFMDESLLTKTICPTIDPTSSARYASKTANQQAKIAEIFMSVPTLLDKDVVGCPWFKHKVIGCISFQI